MGNLKGRLGQALAELEIALDEERKAKSALQAAEARIEDLVALAGKQASALVAKDQEILYLRNQLRDLSKGGALYGPEP